MNPPAPTSDGDERRVPSSRHTELEVTSDRVVLTSREPSDLAERGGVGFAFLVAGMTGGLGFLFASGALIDVAFGILCILAGLFATMYQWTRPPVERRLTVGPDGVNDLSNREDGLDRQQLPPSKIDDVVMRPVSSDRDQMYRVELELRTDEPGYETHPVYDTADWDEAQQLTDEIRKRLPK